MIPLSTASAANSESIVSRRIAEKMKQELGSVLLRATFSADYLRRILGYHLGDVRFNSRVVDLLQHDGVKGGVHVVLENGQTEWGDVVVRADGAHSTIRRLLYPMEYVGTSCRSLGMTQVDGFVDLGHGDCPTGDYPVEVWVRRRVLSCVPLHRDERHQLSFSATLYDPPMMLVDIDNETQMPWLCGMSIVPCHTANLLPLVITLVAFWEGRRWSFSLNLWRLLLCRDGSINVQC
ncbi:monooxygenase [Trypanosoma rangeli]|uniref:Monooxygenase n=1 Tax=Trypanosoma rangeli TaxID=5698 RepID=A0A422N3I4_TRYRA|nr:monooxygenase [Trypanosoma rangeli]RNF00004.1 monooxygenase [Trypanosoma rangeli]|eukprot:RNF00004.1 monooxygenase [Trypanosoma rangeli]